MSYSIYIGEPKLEEYDPADCDGQFTARYHVAGVTRKAAPKFENDEMTGQSNGRHPGYGAWDDFTKSVGLRDLFFDKGIGLMRKHPGCFLLTEEHGKKISEALANYRVLHPDTKPGFASTFQANSGIIMSDARKMGAPEIILAEYHLARLIWLDWWVQWALKTCKRPAISNS